MLGTAPTWMAVWAEAAIPTNSNTIAAIKLRLVMTLFPASMERHRQHAGFPLFLLVATPGAGRFVHQIGESCVVEDFGGGVAHVEEYLVERAMIGIARDQAAQLLRIADRRARTTNQT